MLPAFVIGLREDLETVVILGAIALLLIHNDRRDRLRTVWIASGEATALCLAAADYGRLALVASDEPSGPRMMAPTSCDRVDIEGDVGLCLKRPASGLDISTTATVFDAHLKHYGLLQDQAIASRNPLSRATPSIANGAPLGTNTWSVPADGDATPWLFNTRSGRRSSPTDRKRPVGHARRCVVEAVECPPEHTSPEPGFPPKSHPWGRHTGVPPEFRPGQRPKIGGRTCDSFVPQVIVKALGVAHTGRQRTLRLSARDADRSPTRTSSPQRVGSPKGGHG
jgi:hypothetical protein